MNRKLCAALSGAAIVGALFVATGAAATTPPSSVRTHPSAPVQVRLVTGDVVNVATDATGRQTADVVSARRQGPAGVFQTFMIGHDLFVVPESAAPYVGKTLDPSLFDVTRLAQHPQADLHVSLSLRPGSGVASLPGATVHQVSATRAVARFTNSSTKVFGNALARQAMRDHASPTHTSGMFRSIARISTAAGASTTSSATPAASHTLTIKGTDFNGNPDSGDTVNVYNVDDLNLFATSLTFASGQAQATVPDGNYSLVCFFFDFSTNKIYLVSIPQVSVTKDTTVKMDARTATSQISVSTPKPAPQPVFIVEWARTDANGLSASYTFLASDAFTFYAAPTKKKPSVGNMYLVVQIRAQSTGSKKAYEYDAKFDQVGTIKADQSYVVKPSSLATINAGYAADHTNQLSLDGRFAAFAWESFLIVGDQQFTTPLQRTEYYTGGAALTWERFDYTVYTPSPFTLQAEVDSPWESLAPGLKRNEVWRGQPNHPRLFEHAITWNPTITYCPVCVTQTNLDVLAFPYGDNSEFHRGYQDSPAAGLTESQAWTIKAGSKTIGQGTGFLQASVPLSKGAKSYSISYNTIRSSADFLMSTDVKTTWTFKAKAQQAALPDGWVCSGNGDVNCGVAPVMTNSYNLPTDLLGRIASGDRVGTVSIGHLAGANIAVTKLTADLSFDGGSTWTAATVTDQGNGQFQIAFTVPSKAQTDGFGALRINATDAQGGKLAQTILNAFTVK